MNFRIAFVGLILLLSLGIGFSAWDSWPSPNADDSFTSVTATQLIKTTSSIADNTFPFLVYEISGKNEWGSSYFNHASYPEYSARQYCTAMYATQGLTDSYFVSANVPLTSFGDKKISFSDYSSKIFKFINKKGTSLTNEISACYEYKSVNYFSTAPSLNVYLVPQLDSPYNQSVSSFSSNYCVPPTESIPFKCEFQSILNNPGTGFPKYALLSATAVITENAPNNGTFNVADNVLVGGTKFSVPNGGVAVSATGTLNDISLQGFKCTSLTVHTLNSSGAWGSATAVRDNTTLNFSISGLASENTLFWFDFLGCTKRTETYCSGTAPSADDPNLVKSPNQLPTTTIPWNAVQETINLPSDFGSTACAWGCKEGYHPNVVSSEPGTCVPNTCTGTEPSGANVVKSILTPKNNNTNNNSWVSVSELITNSTQLTEPCTWGCNLATKTPETNVDGGKICVDKKCYGGISPSGVGVILSSQVPTNENTDWVFSPNKTISQLTEPCTWSCADGYVQSSSGFSCVELKCTDPKPEGEHVVLSLIKPTNANVKAWTSVPGQIISPLELTDACTWGCDNTTYYTPTYNQLTEKKYCAQNVCWGNDSETPITGFGIRYGSPIIPPNNYTNWAFISNPTNPLTSCQWTCVEGYTKAIEGYSGRPYCKPNTCTGLRPFFGVIASKKLPTTSVDWSYNENGNACTWKCRSTYNYVNGNCVAKKCATPAPEGIGIIKNIYAKPTTDNKPWTFVSGIRSAINLNACQWGCAKGYAKDATTNTCIPAASNCTPPEPKINGGLVYNPNNPSGAIKDWLFKADISELDSCEWGCLPGYTAYYLPPTKQCIAPQNANCSGLPPVSGPNVVYSSNAPSGGLGLVYKWTFVGNVTDPSNLKYCEWGCKINSIYNVTNNSCTALNNYPNNNGNNACLEPKPIGIGFIYSSKVPSNQTTAWNFNSTITGNVDALSACEWACDTPNGFVKSGTQNNCECAQGTKLELNATTKKYNCVCPIGLTFNASTKKCEISGNSNTESCKGIVPTGIGVILGPAPFVVSLNWTFVEGVNSSELTNCQWTCAVGYKKDGTNSSCVLDTDTLGNDCLGTKPAQDIGIIISPLVPENETTAWNFNSIVVNGNENDLSACQWACNSNDGFNRTTISTLSPSCSCAPGKIATYNSITKKWVCGCPSGFTYDVDFGACVKRCETLSPTYPLPPTENVLLGLEKITYQKSLTTNASYWKNINSKNILPSSTTPPTQLGSCEWVCEPGFMYSKENNSCIKSPNPQLWICGGTAPIAGPGLLCSNVIPLIQTSQPWWTYVNSTGAAGTSSPSTNPNTLPACNWTCDSTQHTKLNSTADGCVCETGYTISVDGKSCECPNGNCETICPVGQKRNLTGVCMDCLNGDCSNTCENGFEKNPFGVCVPSTQCSTGTYRNPLTGNCDACNGSICPCADGKVSDNGVCIDECSIGKETINGTCVNNCAYGQTRNLTTGICENICLPATNKVYVNGQCVDPNSSCNISHCDLCLEPNVCAACDTSYRVNADGLQCILCPNGNCNSTFFNSTLGPSGTVALEIKNVVIGGNGRTVNFELLFKNLKEKNCVPNELRINNFVTTLAFAPSENNLSNSSGGTWNSANWGLVEETSTGKKNYSTSISFTDLDYVSPTPYVVRVYYTCSSAETTNLYIQDVLIIEGQISSNVPDSNLVAGAIVLLFSIFLVGRRNKTN